MKDEKKEAQEVNMAGDLWATRVSGRQRLLLPLTPRELCDQIGLNWNVATKLYAAGWLSFDPHKVAKLEEDQEAELSFVGHLAVGGCDGAMLKRLLSGLEKPYCYSMCQMYYDWISKTWRSLPVRDQKEAEDMFNSWMAELVQEGDIDKILELKDSIIDAERACKDQL